jgi:ketosteroid isomerase-like protein
MSGSTSTEARNVTEATEFHRVYTEAFNSGAVEQLVDLYEDTAAFVPEPGRTVSGHAAIGEALRGYQFVGKMSAETRWLIKSGDVALASAAWQVTGANPQGDPVVMSGISADLLRRQRDGRWLLVIDNPFAGE